MHVYKYELNGVGYGGTWFEDNGIVFAPNETIARDRVLAEHWGQGDVVMLEEVYVIHLNDH